MPAIDYLGETLYETLIGDNGEFTLRRPGAASCTLRPSEPGDRGFASGVAVTCSSGAVYRVQAVDNTELGEVSVSVNSHPAEIYRYDVDTAALLSADPALPKTSAVRKD